MFIVLRPLLLINGLLLLRWKIFHNKKQNNAECNDNGAVYVKSTSAVICPFAVVVASVEVEGAVVVARSDVLVFASGAGAGGGITIPSGGGVPVNHEGLQDITC